MPRPNGAGEKPHDLKKAVSRLLKYAKSFIPAVAAAAACAIIGTIFNLIGPDKISDITDLITEGLTGSIDLDAIISNSAYSPVRNRRYSLVHTGLHHDHSHAAPHEQDAL